MDHSTSPISLSLTFFLHIYIHLLYLIFKTKIKFKRPCFTKICPELTNPYCFSLFFLFSLHFNHSILNLHFTSDNKLFINNTKRSKLMTKFLFIHFQDANAPLPALYENLGMPVIKIIVSGGAIFALCTRHVLTNLHYDPYQKYCYNKCLF